MNLNLEQHVYFEIISEDPLITFNSCTRKEIPLFSVLKQRPDLFKGKKGVHLVAPCWSIENSDLLVFQRLLNEAKEFYSDHLFVMTANNEIESYLFASQQIENILCNQSTFQDETRWNIPDEGYPNLPYSNALYIARLQKFKRHELCRQLENPMFIYTNHPVKEFNDNVKRIMSFSPDAVFVNYLINPVEFIRLDEQQISRATYHAKVSLCLSEVEGTMRSSVQSLMCGLPVVSTPSTGGRDRYYSSDISIIVDPSPEAVKNGVDEMIKRNISKKEIRSHILKYIEFDRRNFITSFNKIIHRHFGNNQVNLTFHPFLGAKFRQKRIHDLIHLLESS